MYKNCELDSKQIKNKKKEKQELLGIVQETQTMNENYHSKMKVAGNILREHIVQQV